MDWRPDGRLAGCACAVAVITIFFLEPVLSLIDTQPTLPSLLLWSTLFFVALFGFMRVVRRRWSARLLWDVLVWALSFIALGLVLVGLAGFGGGIISWVAFCVCVLWFVVAARGHHLSQTFLLLTAMPCGAILLASRMGSPMALTLWILAIIAFDAWSPSSRLMLPELVGPFFPALALHIKKSPYADASMVIVSGGLIGAFRLLDLRCAVPPLLGLVVGLGLGGFLPARWQGAAAGMGTAAGGLVLVVFRFLSDLTWV